MATDEEEERDEDQDDEDGEEDEDGDGEEGEDEDGESSKSNEHEFDDETEGVIVAGRELSISGMTRGDLGKLAASVEEIGKRAGFVMQVVPGGDYTTDSGPADEDEVYTTAVIGLEAARGGGYDPDAVDRDRVLAKLERARSIPAETWSEIVTLLPEKSREAFEENAEISLHLVCVGPLSAAKLVYGVPGTEGDEGKPGEYHRGQDMEQEPHESGVWGTRVAYCQYEGPEVEAVDLSDEAHQANEKELGAEGAGYYLIAQYD